jgi:hypothetical protein
LREQDGTGRAPVIQRVALERLRALAVSMDRRNTSL